MNVVEGVRKQVSALLSSHLNPVSLNVKGLVVEPEPQIIMESCL